MSLREIKSDLVKALEEAASGLEEAGRVDGSLRYAGHQLAIAADRLRLLFEEESWEGRG